MCQTEEYVLSNAITYSTHNICLFGNRSVASRPNKTTLQPFLGGRVHCLKSEFSFDAETGCFESALEWAELGIWVKGLVQSKSMLLSKNVSLQMYKFASSHFHIFTSGKPKLTFLRYGGGHLEKKKLIPKK